MRPDDTRRAGELKVSQNAGRHPPKCRQQRALCGGPRSSSTRTTPPAPSSCRFELARELVDIAQNAAHHLLGRDLRPHRHGRFEHHLHHLKCGIPTCSASRSAAYRSRTWWRVPHQAGISAFGGASKARARRYILKRQHAGQHMHACAPGDPRTIESIVADGSSGRKRTRLPRAGRRVYEQRSTRNATLNDTSHVTAVEAGRAFTSSRSSTLCEEVQHHGRQKVRSSTYAHEAYSWCTAATSTGRKPDHFRVNMPSRSLLVTPCATTGDCEPSPAASVGARALRAPCPAMDSGSCRDLPS